MGQLGANLGNSNVTDPSQARPQDLDRSEMGARVLAQGTRGLAQGFQNYENQKAQMQQGGRGSMITPTAAPQVDPAYFSPQNPQQNNPYKIRGNNLNFYGGS